MDKEEIMFNCKLTFSTILQCEVCLGLMKKPTTLQCGHSGCKSCMRECIRVRKSCPVCRDDSEERELRDNVVISAMVAAVTAICMAVGCKWKGQMKDAERHQMECEFVDHYCQNSGCQFVGSIASLRAHRSVCQHRNFPCSHCNVEITAMREREHVQIECTEIHKPCVLGCGERVSRRMSVLHQTNCAALGVTCTIPGCQKKMKMEDLSHHTASSSHVKAMKSQYTSLLLAVKEKNTKPDKISIKEIKGFSFRWRIEDFPTELSRISTENQASVLVSSQYVGPEKNRWRAMLVCKPHYKVYIQLYSAVNPVTCKIKFAIISGERPAAVYPPVSTGNVVQLKEGEAYGRKIREIEDYLENSSLTLKFLVILTELTDE